MKGLLSYKLEHLYAVIFMLISIQITEIISVECIHSRSGVEIISSTQTDGRSSACPGEVVLYTCTVINTGVLQWAVESLHSIEGESITFSVQYDPVGTIEEELEGLIIANITKVMPEMIFLGNISSTLKVAADERFNNKTIWCSNGILVEAQSPCILHKYGGLPSAPTSPSYSILSYGVYTFTVLLEWDNPISDDGFGVSYYTTTVQTFHSLQTYVQKGNTLHFSLIYNQSYTVDIIAANCKGHGPPIHVTDLYEVSCGVPALSTAADLSDIVHSTHEGSEITFLCSNEEIVLIKCFSNGSWVPDPSELNCSDIKPFVSSVSTFCTPPLLPPHSHVVKERSIHGSLVTYECDSDYQPREQMVSVCSQTAEWVPDIASLQCTQQVNCGTPTALPINGSVYYTSTTEDSTAFVECNEDLELQGHVTPFILICTTNGSWIPNITNPICTQILTTGADVSVCTNSTETTNCVFINCLIGVVVLLIALSLGIFLSCLLSHLYHQRKLKVTTGTCKPFHAYDEVILKTPGPMTVTMINNEAYGVHAN